MTERGKFHEIKVRNDEIRRVYLNLRDSGYTPSKSIELLRTQYGYHYLQESTIKRIAEGR